MKLTIVVDDNAVGIDGEFFSPLNLSQLDSGIHAVQWYGEYGEVEYKTRFEGGSLTKPANVLITEMAPYQFAVDMWNAAKAQALAAEAQAQAQASIAQQTEQSA